MGGGKLRREVIALIALSVLVLWLVLLSAHTDSRASALASTGDQARKPIDSSSAIRKGAISYNRKGPISQANAATEWFHPNSVSISAAEMNSPFDQLLTVLHCETMRCHAASKVDQAACRQMLFRAALESGDEAFEAHDSEAAVAAYMLAFEPMGRPWSLRKLNLSETSIKRMGHHNHLAVLASVFYFLQALVELQLYHLADVVATQLLHEVPWSAIWELRAYSNEHYSRFELAKSHISMAERSKASECQEHGAIPRGKSLLIDDDSLEIWLNETYTAKPRWVHAIPKSFVSSKGSPNYDFCDPPQDGSIPEPGDHCFQFTATGQKRYIWLPARSLPPKRHEVTPPCDPADPSLVVRVMPGLHRICHLVYDKNIAARLSDRSKTIWEDVYKPPQGAPSLVHRPQDISATLSFFETQGYVAIADGLQRDWIPEMREYLLQFRSRLSTQAWSVSPGFRRHQTHYMKKPGFRTNLQLSLDEGPLDGKTVGQIFAQAFKSTPVLRNLFPDDAVLSELGAFLVFPGADPQLIHQDIAYSPGYPKPRALFIQLGDVAVGQGNLRVWPGTHPQATIRPIDDDHNNRTENLYAIQYNSGNNSTGAYQGMELAPLQSGSIIVYDAALFHQGMSNLLDTPRVILYLTTVIGKEAPRYAKEWSISLLSEYKEKGLTIKDVVEYSVPAEKIGWVGLSKAEQCVPQFQQAPTRHTERE